MRPPDKAIEKAREAALTSPCAKSRRGVVIFDHERIKQGLLRGSYIATGHNAPPAPFFCDGSNGCRRDCGKICVHAEQAAIREALAETEYDHLKELELLHVKVVDGAVVAGGPPSCWQCSKAILDVKLAGVWLYESQRWHDEGVCKACGRTTTVPQGGGTTGVCDQCDGVYRLLERWKTVYDPDSGVWNRYTAEEFHEATLANCWLHIGRRTT